MMTRRYHLSLLMALMTAAVHCGAALTVSVSRKPPSYSSASSSSSLAPAAATGRDGVSIDRQHYEKNLIQYYKNRIVEVLGLNLTENGEVVRPNATSSTRPTASSDVIDTSTPINVSVNGTMGEP